MPKKLSKVQEAALVYCYRTKTQNISRLAVLFKVSRRTVYRTLASNGIPTQKQYTADEAYRVLMLVRQYGVSLSRLRLLLEHDKRTKKTLPILTTAQMLLPLDTGEKQE